MSAIGTQQTWACAPHMSAFRPKADIGQFLHELFRKLASS